MLEKNKFIELLRNNGFNCFPMDKSKEKSADSRYDANRTAQNQPIQDNENYGYIPIKGKGTLIIDFDNKEQYRKFAEENIAKGHMVIETGNGWHIPVKGINGEVSKVELFDYNNQDTKIIEIQGPKHFCLGPESVIFHKKLNKEVTYKNVGSDNIWDAEGIDFHNFIDKLCRDCNVKGKQPNNTSSTKNLREKFSKGIPPATGQSNLYFFEAAKVCNSEGLTIEQAEERIKKIYDQWRNTNDFSDRPWDNIQTKINEVYSKDLKVSIGRPQGITNQGRINRTNIAQTILEQRKIYSVPATNSIYEDIGGFLVLINERLQKQLQLMYPELEEADFKSIIFKLVGLGKDIPTTDKNLVVFKNGIFDRKQRTIIESENLADMGFTHYNYLLPTPENIPHKFIEVMFSNVPEDQHARIKKALKSALSRFQDPTISVTYGLSGVGKGAGLQILAGAMGDYALIVDLNQFLKDSFIRAKIENKSLLVITDMPRDWKDFDLIKIMTGELRKTERGFHKDSKIVENMLKFWGTANYLPIIPEEEKNAMFSRRLSLIHNTKKLPYEYDEEFIDLIIREEGEKIISWILNLSDEECKYETPEQVQTNWEGIASPEISYMKNHYEMLEEDTSGVMIIEIINGIKKEKGITLDLQLLTKSLRSQGFVVRNNKIFNVKRITEKTNSF